MRNTALILLLISLYGLSGCSTSGNLAGGTKGDNFDAREYAMIMAGASNVPMRVYKIDDHSDSLLLRKKSRNVIANPEDKTLMRFTDRLYATVRDSISLGVGIAAPQVGILRNIIWVQRFDKDGFPFEVYLNPKIIKYSELKQTRREGCLSIPDRSDTLNCRAYAILVEYDRLDASHHVEMVEDFTAVIFQHEIDHLNGILYTDHLQAELRQAKRLDDPRK